MFLFPFVFYLLQETENSNEAVNKIWAQKKEKITCREKFSFQWKLPVNARRKLYFIILPYCVCHRIDLISSQKEEILM